MKITLFSLNASRSHTCLAIRLLGNSLTKAGYTVSLIERTEKERSFDTLAALAFENADVYGFSCYLWNIKAHLTLAENLKKLRPDAKIVFGGPEVSYTPNEILERYPFIDTVLTGEGEETIVSLIKAYEKGESPRILQGEPYGEFETSDIPYHENEARRGNILYYESSRGCPFRCAYCLSGAEEFKKIRAKSVEKTLDDLVKFEAFDNVKIIKFIDRTFNYDVKRANAIWQALKDSRFTKQYHFEIAASLLNEESFAILQAMPKGKIQLEIGVQTVNPDVLLKINRPDHTKTTLSAIERLYTFGNMHIHTDLIVGLPGEDYASIQKGYDALFGKCHDLQLGFLKLLKGAPLYHLKEQYGYLFHAEPPYEVLASRTLSFEEITRLKKLEAVHERYVNSQRFSRSIKLLTENDSPFKTLEALTELLPNITELSQRDAYVALLQFSKKYKPAATLDKLYDAIALDFLLNEQGRIPKEIPRFQKDLAPDDKKRIVEACPECFLPATECYAFKTLGDYAIDRKNKYLIKL